MDMNVSTQKKSQARAASTDGGDYSLKQHYMDQFKFAPGLQKLLGTGILRETGPIPAVQSASDFSYAAKNYAGDHYRLVGDAAGN